MSEPLDHLSTILERFPAVVSLFHSGELCGTKTFDAEPGRGVLHVIRDGAVEVVLHRNGLALQSIKVKEPTLFFYAHPLVHQLNGVGGIGPSVTCAYVYFEGGENHPLLKALPPVIVVELSKVPGLGEILSVLFAEADQIRSGHRLIADRLFDVALLKLLRWLIDHSPDGGLDVGLIQGLADAQISRALNAVHKSPDRAWTTESLAEEAGMSRSAFAVHFKSLLGTSPVEYLTDWRMAMTKKQLREGRSVKAIAAAVGYSNPSALSRVFIQRVGLSPRDWLSQR